MQPIIKPIGFISSLSEVEVRMALRELCGSKLDNYPFRGEIAKNSFCLIKNSFTNTRGIPKPILVGEFFEQNGKTQVTISVKTRMIDYVGTCIVAFGVLFLAAFGFISMLDEGVVLAIASAVMITWLCVGMLALHYFLMWSSFRRSVEKIKKALGNIF